MGAPSKAYDRVGNLHGSSASAGLQAMHGGRISQSSARKIRNAIDWLLASAEEKYIYSKKANRFYKWKLSFLTLTLPTQGTLSDTAVKGILNAFLTLAKHNYGLQSYIWKAEPQARGVIHFHLTSDCYMWKNSVRFEWNRLLSKYGLLNGQTNAPSTKIHSVYRVKNMAGYLCKYFIKPPTPFTKTPYAPKYGGLAVSRRGSEEISFTFPEKLFYIRPIAGRLWGCSQSLSQARSLSYTVDIPEMRSMNQEIRDSGAREQQKTYCNYYQLPDDYYDKLSFGQLKHDFNVHKLKIRKVAVKDRYDIRGEDGLLIADKKILRRFDKQFKSNPHGKS